MKKAILYLAIVALFAACSSNKKQDETITALSQQTDTAGLAEYQNWKQQKEQLQPVNMNGVSGVVQSNDVPQVAEAPAKSTTKIIYRDRMVKAKKPVKEVQQDEPNNTPSYGTPAGHSREAVSRNDAPMSNGGAGNGNDSSNTGGNRGIVAVSKPVEQPAKKEGWSKAAKGAVIGAASGAVLGAIVSKNKGLGAVVGGVVGGLGGYAIGRSKDKKDGRYLVVNQ